jgi:hypothetical protein
MDGCWFTWIERNNTAMEPYRALLHKLDKQILGFQVFLLVSSNIG